MTWDPDQYGKFEALRWRPARDLLEAIPPVGPRLAVDLGCGAGRLARLLADRYPDAAVIGVDSSPAMLAKAAAHPSRVTWVKADAATWRPAEPVDLLISNAALHWLPDHDALMPRLAGYLAEGGVLALQMPANDEAPSHRLLRDLAASERWSVRLAGVIPTRRVHPAAAYHRWLAPSLASLEIWTTQYLQELTGDDPVLEWIKGTTLLPVLDRLAESERPDFLDAYARLLRQAYPAERPGVTLYPFKRLFLVGRRVRS